ncbi:MAG TPA: zinc ribbon domain-containing protein [Patescibacteria group bacterium]|nr:zinc ribbon domain-containing protein [Patescibacteria group bacterium]
MAVHIVPFQPGGDVGVQIKQDGSTLIFICPNCQELNTRAANFCIWCGYHLIDPEGQKKVDKTECPECENKTPNLGILCEKCGKSR